MEETAYHDVAPDEMILRDHLAADRTALANERTFLSYVRTALTLAAVGGSLIKFFDALSWKVFGWLFVVLGLACLGIGITRYNQMRRRLERLLRP